MTQLAFPLLVLASKIQPATIHLESEASVGVVVVSTFEARNPGGIEAAKGFLARYSLGL